MDSTVPEPSPESSDQPRIAPTPIRPGSAQLSKATPPRAAADCPRPFVNEESNSRLALPAPTGALKLQWQTELDNLTPPGYVLQAADRIVVQGQEEWYLLDAGGKRLATARMREGHVVLDAANSLFYQPDPFGPTTARQLADGRVEFRLFTTYGKNFRQVLLARRGSQLTILSTELPAMAMTPRPPMYASVEVYNLGSPIEKDAANLVLTSARKVAGLMRESVPLLAAVHDDTLALAVSGHLWITGHDLRVRADLTARFDPLALSMDEAGRVYLLARAEKGQQVFWLVTAQGERLTSFDIADNLGARPVPPIVGYDHRVYLQTASRILAINPDGKLAWDFATGGQPGGAAVTADDQLLASVGSAVVAFDREGKRRVLYDFGADTLRTPPVLTQRGELLVASKTRLYCLK